MAKPRSPNYPGISLQKAIEQARKVYNANHLHKAPRDVVAKAMGYTSLNGGSLTVLSALLKYGLLEGDDAGLKITQDALTVLVEGPTSPERARTMVKLAGKPELFAEIQSAFPGPAPNDELLRSWLLRKGFLPSTVDLPIRAYRETMEVAEAQKQLYTDERKVDELPTPPAPAAAPSAKPKQEFEAGDLIQWESSGVLRMDAPRRVRGKEFHEGAWWLFVEGSEAGIPMNEAILVEKAAGTPATPVAPRSPLTPVTSDLKQEFRILGPERRDTFTLDEGPVVLQWPEKMSAASYEDFEGWIQLQLRKIKRSVQ
jgi:hypothetical protein